MTFKQALCDRNHNSTTLFLITLSILGFFNGGTVLYAFQVQLTLDRIFTGGTDNPAWLNGSFAYDMRGIVDICASFFSIFLVSRLKRRSVFLGLGVSLILINILLGFGDLLNLNVMAFIGYLMLTFAFEVIGPLIQMYIIEVTTNGVYSVATVFVTSYSVGMTTLTMKLLGWF